MAGGRAEAIAFIRCLLLSREGEMYLLSEFLRDFEAEAGYSLPQFGHKSVEDFLGSIPGIVEVLVIDGELYLSLVDEVPEEASDTNELLTPDIKVDVLGEYINRDAGDTSLHQGNNAIFKKKKKKNRKKNKDRRMQAKFDLKKKKKGELFNPNALCKKCMSEPPVVGPKIDFYLSKIILCASDIPELDLKEHISLGDLVEVIVPEVCNPHRFILHLKKYQFELSKFMGRMMTFYAIYCNKYALENCSFKENDICAALYGSKNHTREWYRAKILSVGYDTSTVLLMDYGLIVEVSHCNLKYLDRFFGNLPVQAINGCLANVRPCGGGNWSEECKQWFYNLVIDKDLLAYVSDINYQKKWFGVVLSYPDSGEIISDILVKDSAVADCEHCESYSPQVFEPVDAEEFIQREDGPGFKKLRCDLRDEGFENLREKAWFEESNKQLMKMIGFDVSDDESSASSIS